MSHSELNIWDTQAQDCALQLQIMLQDAAQAVEPQRRKLHRRHVWRLNIQRRIDALLHRITTAIRYRPESLLAIEETYVHWAQVLCDKLRQYRLLQEKLEQHMLALEILLDRTGAHDIARILRSSSRPQQAHMRDMLSVLANKDRELAKTEQYVAQELVKTQAKLKQAVQTVREHEVARVNAHSIVSSTPIAAVASTRQGASGKGDPLFMSDNAETRVDQCHKLFVDEVVSQNDAINLPPLPNGQSPYLETMDTLYRVEAMTAKALKDLNYRLP